MESASAVNPLLEAANNIGTDNRSNEEKDAVTAHPDEPSPGSYERFMATFGSPARWAGRS